MSYMRIHVLMSLFIVIVKVWTVTVTSPHLVNINYCDLLLLFFSVLCFRASYNDKYEHQLDAANKYIFHL